MSTDVGSFLRDLREARGLTQTQLAQRARTQQSAISRLEQGVVSPSVRTLDWLVRCMGDQLVLEHRRPSDAHFVPPENHDDREDHDDPEARL